MSVIFGDDYLAKNMNRLHVLSGFANMMMAKKYLLT